MVAGRCGRSLGARQPFLSARLASIRSLQSPLRDIGSVQEDHSARLEELALQAVREDGADVICLGCAGMAGVTEAISTTLGLPCVDGVAAAVGLAQMLVGLGLDVRETQAPFEPEGGAYAAHGHGHHQAHHDHGHGHDHAHHP